MPLEPFNTDDAVRWFLKNCSPHLLKEFFRDQVQREEGWMTFESREPGYFVALVTCFFQEMASLLLQPRAPLNASEHLDTLSLPRNYKNDLLRIHALSMIGVKHSTYESRSYAELFNFRAADQYTGSFVSVEIGLITDGPIANATLTGIQEMALNAEAGGYRIGQRGWSAHKKNLTTLDSADPFDTTLTIVNDYNAEMLQCYSSKLPDDDKIRAIIKMVSRLERCHPFGDGNCRTFCMILLLRESLKHGLVPPLFENPNHFDGYSQQELYDEFKRGQGKTLTMMEKDQDPFYLDKKKLEAGDSLHTALFNELEPELCFKMVLYEVDLQQLEKAHPTYLEIKTGLLGELSAKQELKMNYCKYAAICNCGSLIRSMLNSETFLTTDEKKELTTYIRSISRSELLTPREDYESQLLAYLNPTKSVQSKPVVFLPLLSDPTTAQSAPLSIQLPVQKPNPTRSKPNG